MTIQWAWLTASAALPLLTLLNRQQVSRLVRELRDVITLRMVLRDSTPGQRARLLAAHRDWRAEPRGSSRKPERTR